jgi:AraC family transcriptional regulator
MNYYQKIYVHRINKVMDYVDAHLAEDLNLNILCDIAGFSQFHFHRIFSAITGESLWQFVKRCRIEKAAWLLLQNKEVPVSQIGYDCGFNSSAVFSRCFKDRFGVTPGSFRAERKNSKNYQSNSKNSQSDMLSRQYVCRVESINNNAMKILKSIDLKMMPEMHLIYARHQGAFDQIGLVYEKLFRWAGPRGYLNENTKTITVYHDNPEITEIDKVRQSAGIVVSEEVKPEGEFGKLTVPSGEYLVGGFEIDVTEFSQAWDAVCLALTESGYEPRDGFPYELYHKDPNDHPEHKFVLDICIPVKPL